ncbi:hypothetical protein KAI36_00481 [Paenibacillus sp. S02]|nr:hypothetical protein KAI36_00481 [Paenibacillus sp. S02]
MDKDIKIASEDHETSNRYLARVQAGDKTDK